MCTGRRCTIVVSIGLLMTQQCGASISLNVDEWGSHIDLRSCGGFFRSSKISTSGSISDDVNSDNSCLLNSSETDVAGLHSTEPWF